MSIIKTLTSRQQLIFLHFFLLLSACANTNPLTEGTYIGKNTIISRDIWFDLIDQIKRKRTYKSQGGLITCKNVFLLFFFLFKYKTIIFQLSQFVILLCVCNWFQPMSQLSVSTRPTKLIESPRQKSLLVPLDRTGFYGMVFLVIVRSHNFSAPPLHPKNRILWQTEALVSLSMSLPVIIVVVDSFNSFHMYLHNLRLIENGFLF